MNQDKWPWLVKNIRLWEQKLQFIGVDIEN